ncbi:MAG: hypothetical protein IRZ16_20300 [Myxococcaceae bacterium]|nr:hypothetical protein [Myxococcaceae bacterium]
MTLRRMTVAIGFIAFAATGCATGNYSRSVFGTEGGYSLANAQPKPPSLMVARKIERPLYILLDAQRVRDTWPMETASCATQSPDCERFKLFEVQTFVRRDLKTAMENYFSHVEVVDSAAALPKAPHVVADVKVDDIRLNALVRGALTYQLIEMTWGFALRPSEAVDYAWSFAGTSESNDTYPTFEAGCATLVENAISAMLKEWFDDGGPSQLLALPPAPATADGNVEI